MKKEELITGTYFYVHHMCKILHLLVCNSLKEFFVIKKKKFSGQSLNNFTYFDSAFKYLFTVCLCRGVTYSLLVLLACLVQP